MADKPEASGYQIYCHALAFPHNGQWLSYLGIIPDLGEAKAQLSIARHRNVGLGWDWKIMEVRECADA